LIFIELRFISNVDDERKNKNRAEAGKYISLGLETFLPAVIGVLIGNYWLDAVYGTTPLWTLILGLFGFIVGMYKLFKTVNSINKETKNKKKL
jgi:F0F1-type ATP synthase assembly protein I